MSYRHLSRSIAMQSLYEWDFRQLPKKELSFIVERNINDFGPGMEETDFTRKLISVIENLLKIDKIIEASAPNGQYLR